jgi:hypothetical protein
MRCRLLPAAVLLFLSWSAPARAAALLAQGDGGVPVIEYGVGAVATILVLLVVCWPARRE